jgi:catechol 2,3-dioxygenase-like lactoylglutathione lyase family enzyme
MAIEIVELHHPGYRIDEKLLDPTVDFYTNVLGLERDKTRPTIPGIPGAWINVGEVGQLHLIGGKQPTFSRPRRNSTAWA